MSDDHTFTADQAAAATTAPRMVLGRPPEQFSIPQFVAMISDEIEQLRETGRSDDEIAQLVVESAGGTISGSDIAAHYAPPQARGWAGSRES